MATRGGCDSEGTARVPTVPRLGLRRRGAGQATGLRPHEELAAEGAGPRPRRFPHDAGLRKGRTGALRPRTRQAGAIRALFVRERSTRSAPPVTRCPDLPRHPDHRGAAASVPQEPVVIERDVLLNELAQGLRPMSEGHRMVRRPRPGRAVRSAAVPAPSLRPGARSHRGRTGEHPPCRAAPDAYTRSADLTRPDGRAAGKDRRSRASRRTTEGVQATDRGARDCRRAAPRAFPLRRLQALVAQTVPVA